MGKTIISWATYTSSVVHGCSKPAAVPPEVLHIAEQVSGPIDPKWTRAGSSPECSKCYAEHLSNRRGWTPAKWNEENEAVNVMLRPERFKDFRKVEVKPVHLLPSQRERFFIASMGDIFHRLVPDSYLETLWEHMVRSPHIYMLLTKRPERAAEWPGPWPANIWLGATCGHPITKWRLEYLRRSKAQVRFVSMEPLLASMMPLNLDGIHQVIVGGESGAGFRPMDMQWAREVRDECARQGSAFFFKQQAAFRTESRCYLVEEDGRAMQYRQFPSEMTSPTEVEPDNPKKHLELFPILART